MVVFSCSGKSRTRWGRQLTRNVHASPTARRLPPSLSGTSSRRTTFIGGTNEITTETADRSQQASLADAAPRASSPPALTRLAWSAEIPARSNLTKLLPPALASRLRPSSSPITVPAEKRVSLDLEISLPITPLTGIPRKLHPVVQQPRLALDSNPCGRSVQLPGSAGTPPLT